MKAKTIKRYSIAMASVMIASNVIPLLTFATTIKDSIGSINASDDGVTVGVDQKQGETTTYYDEVTEDVEQNTLVYVSQASTFSVVIPKTIILDGKTKNATYVVTVNGNIGGEETVEVIPDDSFLMKQLGKNDITSIVSQDKFAWYHDEFDTKGNGTIVAEDMSAGSWNGQFNFDIFLREKDPLVVAIDENGIDLNAKASYILGTEKNDLLEQLVDVGRIENVEEVSVVLNVNTMDFENEATATFNVKRIALPGDSIAIYHYDETLGQWEFIDICEVDDNCKISANFSSFSPVAFVKVDKLTIPGMYSTEDYSLIKSWDELVKEGTLTVSDTGVLTTKNAPTNIYGKLILDDSVVTIGDNAFYNCTKLEEIVIPDSTTKIGRQGLYNCNSLKSITVPISLNYGGYVLSHVENIESITITKGTGISISADDDGGPNVTNSQQNMPWYHGNIDTIIIPEGVTEINDYFFASGKIKNIVLPSTLTYIGNYAFKGTNITSVGNVGDGASLEIPESVETINVGWFQGCSKIQKVNYPERFTTIPANTFYACTSLQSINGTSENNLILHDNITSINASAFRGCTKLTYANLPKNLLTIGNNAFMSCSALEEIVIPDTTTKINNEALQACPSLRKITFPISMNWGMYMCSNGTSNFEEVILTKGTGKTATIVNGTGNITNGHGQLPWYNGTIDTIIVPEGVTEISDYFFYQGNISNIILPSTLEKIGNYAFAGTDITSVGNVGDGASLEIPESVETINVGWFQGCSKLQKVNYPERFTTIPANTFYACTSLQSINGTSENNFILHDNITSINASAFRSCTKLTYANLPKNLLTIGDSAFISCSSLEEIVIPNNATNIGHQAFQSCPTLRKMTFPVSITWGRYMFSNGTTNIKEVVLTKGTGTTAKVVNGTNNTANGHGQLPWYSSTIDTIIVPEGVTEISDYFFYQGKINNIVLPSTLETIGSYAFSGTKTTNIDIPENVTTISSTAFKGVPHITYNGLATGSPWGATAIN